jgi:hypothetical protein
MPEAVKISVIVPYMEIDADKPAVLKTLVDSLNGYDELLVMGNWKEGYAKPINRGLRLAKGDYMFVVNDDLQMTAGQSLQDLVDPDAVTSPTLNGKRQNFWGCAFMIPRWVYEEVGGLDERYRISYFDDDDYLNTLRKHKVQMKCKPEVNFNQVGSGGRTLHQFPDHQDFFEENKQKFLEKWGYMPDYINSYWEQYGKLPSYQAI